MARLDHVGVVTRDLAALAAQYERLGFTLTPISRDADGRIGNRCVMLRDSYIELLAVVDPEAKSATLDRFLARHAGVHILAFAIEDPQSELVRLTRAGVAAPALLRFDRAIDDEDPAGPRARFELIQTPDQPEGRINLVRHLTREALWQERFLHHINNATTLAEVVLDVSEPADAAARFSCLVGCVVVPDRARGFALELEHSLVRFLPAAHGARIVPRVMALSVKTTDGNATISRLASQRGFAHRREGDALIVDAAVAGGVEIRFVPGAT